MKTLRAVVIAGAAGAILMGCDRIGNPMETIGRGIPPPDEFQVVTRKPLKMPGSMALPEPRLGERSPLEHDPHGDASAALLGGRTIPAGTGATPGERALLAAATANASDPEIQARLVAAETAANAGKPYEPPTLMELLNLDDGVREKDVLDPNAESRRLLATGAAPAPVNPADKPSEEDAADAAYVSPGAKYDPKFPYGNMRKGN